MFCPKCGKEINDNVKFCMHCGFAIKKNDGMDNKNSTSNTTLQDINPAYIQPQYNSFNNSVISKPKKRVSVKAIISVIVVAAILIATVSFVFGGGKSNKETNTIMVYMVGSDLESEGSAGSLDILEMANSGIDFSKNNVLVYTGGSSYWNLDISTEYNSLLQIKENGYNLVATTDYPVNMGEPITLTTFLQTCYDNYKTDHYSLVCWNHGCGPLGGYGVDELYEGDRLMIDEIDQALAASPFTGENKLDWIGFDACLMASIEIADVISNYANYMVASQETEPGCGWDYSFLSTYNETSDSVEIAKSIIDNYAETIEKLSTPVFNPEITLSCLDLSMIDNTIVAMDKLFEKLDYYIDLGGYSTLARNRENTKAYGLSSTTSKGESLDLIDLGNLTELVVVDYQAEAQQLKDSISEMVVYERHNVNGSSGVSIYYPYDNALYYTYLGIDLCENYERSQGYRNYISKFANIWLNGGESEGIDRSIWVLPELQNDSNSITMQLTQQQLESYSSAYYTILEKHESEGQEVYTPILSNCKVEPDENGLITVSSVQDLVTINDSVCLAKQTEISNDKTNYVTVNSRLFNGNLRFDPLIAMFEDISISFSMNIDGEIMLQNISLDSDNNADFGKTSIDISNWEECGFYYKSYIPKYDGEKLLPYTEWEDNGWGNIATTGIYEDSIEIGTLSTDEYNGELVCQIVVKDCQGNCYASDLVGFDQNVSTQSVVKTENGELTFDVYSDHAELIGYSGTDARIEIPSNVEGKDVTVIATQAFEDKSGEYAVNLGNQNIVEVVLPETITEISDSAFSMVSNLEKVNLPEGTTKIGNGAFFETALKSVDFPETLESIGSEAFYYTQIENVHIPKNVQEILGNPFMYCSNLNTFSVDKKNKNYTVVNDFLCTKDKKTLISGLNVENVIIPKNIENIGNYAFAGCENVKSVEFSKNIISIGNYAFYNTSLSQLNLSENLKKIGFCAFRNTMWEDFLADNPETIGFKDAVIPSKVSYIGEAAFSGQPISNFSVDEENKFFSANGQFLLNKNGEQLICCGGGIGGTVSIPNGVKEIKHNSFNGCNKIGRADESLTITQLAVPDSVVAIKDDLCISDVEKITIGKNVMLWKYYDNIVISDDNSYPEIKISNENTNYSIQGDKIVKNTNNKLTTFKIK
ncbi:MAG: clostripain-related cysteine peptidase [Eubacterium sp.]